MSWQERDLCCEDCDEVVMRVACSYEDYPGCANCGGTLFQTFPMLKDGGKAPATDVYGSAQYSDATGLTHTSQREKIKHMAKNGFYEAGDPVGGARYTHEIKGTGFSFADQTDHRTTSEGA